MIRRLVVLGGLGDLTRRYLAPALVELREAGELPDDFELVTGARADWSQEGFRTELAEALAQHASQRPEATRHGLVQQSSYIRTDATEAEDVRACLEPERGPALVYLALPPSVFVPAVRALGQAGLPEGSRLVVEKPFGRDLPSARELNSTIHDCLYEEAVFRIDHFLGMQTVRNILGIRFANRILEPVWGADHVEAVEIIWEETLTLEGRAFYDEVGAVRDMIQNHLLQLLSLVAMEPPDSLEGDPFRDRKAAVLQAIRCLEPEEVAARTFRARYGAGRVEGHEVPAYAKEDGVDPERGTETFAEVELTVDNDRWRHVPFRLRTGKALARERKEIVVRFHTPGRGPFVASHPARNELRIGLADTETLDLGLNVTGAGERLVPEAVELGKELGRDALSAYARVLLGALAADPTLSIRNDEVEASWAIVDPILEAWAQGQPPLHEYPAGGRPNAGGRPES